MKPVRSLPTPQPADASDIVTWVYIGDLHLTGPDVQNNRDLQCIVDTLKRNFTACGTYRDCGSHRLRGH